VLRKRGYWWEAAKRCWYGEFRSPEEIEGELAWLKETVFGGKSVALELEEFDAKTRYSGRDGQKEKVRT
jgi:DNA polymerase-3 subunit epsilon